MSPHLRTRPSDEILVHRICNGDHPAFDELHARYVAALERYAARILKHSAVGPEDIVQEVFARTYATLTPTSNVMEIRPWLYTLVRNRCLDELRKNRSLPMPGDQLDATALDADPFTVVARRQQTHRVLSDVAALPDRQRTVLVRREVDGISHEQLACELGITVRASKNLVCRARENLVKSAEAHDADCTDVRDDLLHAHDERRRASAHVYRHIAGCNGCRGYHSQLQRVRGGMRALHPGPALFTAIGSLGGIAAKLSGSATTTVGKLAVAGVIAGSALGIGTHVLLPGDHLPFALKSAVLAAPLPTGSRLPIGTAVVMHETRLVAHQRRHPTLEVTCPAGTKIAGLTPDRGIQIGYGFDRATIVGFSRSARIVFERRALVKEQHVVVGTICKRPDINGSILARPFTGTEQVQAAAMNRVRKVSKICARRTYILETPDGLPVGSAFRGQPVVIRKRTKSGYWSRVVTDAGTVGWVRSKVLCRHTGG